MRSDDPAIQQASSLRDTSSRERQRWHVTVFMRRSEPLSVQRAYVADQYSDADKLRIRIETHRLYSQGTESLTGDILDALALAPGLSLLDVGCGSGSGRRVWQLAGSSWSAWTSCLACSRRRGVLGPVSSRDHS